MALPWFASAQLPNYVQPAPVQGDPVQRILGILQTVINWMLTGLIALAVIFVIIAAYNYLTAAGDEEKVKTAKNMIIYAVVAVAVGLASQILVSLATALVK